MIWEGFLRMHESLVKYTIDCSFRSYNDIRDTESLWWLLYTSIFVLLQTVTTEFINTDDFKRAEPAWGQIIKRIVCTIMYTTTSSYKVCYVLCYIHHNGHIQYLISRTVCYVKNDRSRLGTRDRDWEPLSSIFMFLFEWERVLTSEMSEVIEPERSTAAVHCTHIKCRYGAIPS